MRGESRGTEVGWKNVGKIQNYYLTNFDRWGKKVVEMYGARVF